MGLHPIELIVVVVIVALLFGKRLPDLGSGVGQAISNFKRAYRDGMAVDVTPEKEKIDPPPVKEDTTLK